MTNRELIESLQGSASMPTDPITPEESSYWSGAYLVHPQWARAVIGVGVAQLRATAANPWVRREDAQRAEARARAFERLVGLR